MLHADFKTEAEHIPTMDSRELYQFVEGMLEITGLQNESETWGDTAGRTRNEHPEIAEILERAEKRFFEMEE